MVSNKLNNEQIEALIQSARFNRSEVIITEPAVLIGGEVVARKDNIIVFAGLPKARKSTFVMGLVASCLTGREFYGMSAKPGKVVLIDTEQANIEHLEQIERMERVLGQRVDNLPFTSYSMRKLTLEEVKQLIEPICIKEKPDYLICDALTELVYNVNDNEEVKHLIEFLKRITNQYNVVLVGVMHLGKLNNFTLGALGSAIDRVAQSVLMVTKDEDTQTSTLSARFMRSGKLFEPISIAFNEGTKSMERVHYTAPKQENKRSKWSEKTKQEHFNICSLIFEQQPELTYKALVDFLASYYGRGATIVKTQILSYLLAEKLILNINGTYQLGEL